MFTNIVFKSRFFLILLICLMLPWFMPHITQPADYHNFADTRTLLGLPNFSDVLSNLGFIFSGLFCLYTSMVCKRTLDKSLFLSCITIGIGAVLTGLGSGYYHLNPTNSTLVWDRLPMTITFGGLIALMIYQTTDSHSLTITTLVSSLLYGVCSVVYWALTANLTPYLILQFGGLIWLLISAFRTTGTQILNWYVLLGCYVFAKITEHLDMQLFELFHHMLSGHSLKHLIASTGLIIAVMQLHTTIKNNSAVPT